MTKTTTATSMNNQHQKRGHSFLSPQSPPSPSSLNYSYSSAQTNKHSVQYKQRILVAADPSRPELVRRILQSLEPSKNVPNRILGVSTQSSLYLQQQQQQNQYQESASWSPRLSRLSSSSSSSYRQNQSDYYYNNNYINGHGHPTYNNNYNNVNTSSPSYDVGGVSKPVAEFFLRSQLNSLRDIVETVFPPKSPTGASSSGSIDREYVNIPSPNSPTPTTFSSTSSSASSSHPHHQSRSQVIIDDPINVSYSLGGIDTLIIVLDQEGNEACADVIKIIEEAIPCLSTPEMRSLWYPGLSPNIRPHLQNINNDRLNHANSFYSTSTRRSRTSSILTNPDELQPSTVSSHSPSAATHHPHPHPHSHPHPRSRSSSDSPSSPPVARVIVIGPRHLMSSSLRAYLDRVSSLSSQTILNTIRNRFEASERKQQQYQQRFVDPTEELDCSSSVYSDASDNATYQSRQSFRNRHAGGGGGGWSTLRLNNDDHPSYYQQHIPNNNNWQKYIPFIKRSASGSGSWSGSRSGSTSGSGSGSGSSSALGMGTSFGLANNSTLSSSPPSLSQVSSSSSSSLASLQEQLSNSISMSRSNNKNKNNKHVNSSSSGRNHRQGSKTTAAFSNTFPLFNNSSPYQQQQHQHHQEQQEYYEHPQNNYHYNRPEIKRVQPRRIEALYVPQDDIYQLDNIIQHQSSSYNNHHV